MKSQKRPARKLPAQWIEAEFLRRKSTNGRYSLRAYAKFLGMPPGRLSEILAGKRRLSAAMGEKVAERLGLSPLQRKLFQEGMETRTDSGAPDASYALISEDTFAAMAEWSHTALLSLMDTDNFRSDTAWIAKRLGIEALEARAILHRLERLGLVEKKDGIFRKTNADLRTSDGSPSAALRKSHRDSILQAAESLETVAIESRDITSMSMAIDPAKIPLAKQLIREFRYRMAELLETGNRQEVYNLNIQLVPVTKKEK